MILLLGGTSETAPIAEGLAGAGYRVLVSCATDIELHTGCHNNIIRRSGGLGTKGLIGLIESEKIALLADATHPYAAKARASARKAAKITGIPYLTYLRPEEAYEEGEAVRAGNHQGAARAAFRYGKPVLLTTGANNLAPYVTQAKKTSIPLVVRVLPEPSSIRACRIQGIPEDHIVAKRGPFSIEENRATIRRFSIGVLVTKDSGKAGGVSQKMEAARLEGCRVVFVKRPATPGGEIFDDITAFIAHIVSAYEINL